MIAYFRANDPYRILGVIALVLLIRLPFYISGIPLIIPELKWMLIGDRLADGFMMYRDIWEVYGPLSVSVYKWIDILFGQSRLVYFILSTILVIVQSILFNETLLNNKAYSQSTYIPAFCYGLAMNLFYDFMTLSPILMAMTFVLMALNNLFKRMDNTTRDDLFVHTGIYLAIATLFELSMVLFLGVTVIALLLFTGSIVRRMLLLVTAYLIVMTLASVYYFWNDASEYYHSFFFHTVWSIPSNSYVGFSKLFLAVLIPLLILLFAFFKMFQVGRYINFQVRIQNVMLFSLVGGGMSIVVINEISSYQLIWFVPGLAFFMAHLIQTMKFWLFAEITGAFLVVLLVLNNVFALNGWFFVKESAIYENAIVEESNTMSEQQKIWVIGEDIDEYTLNRLGSPFLNWELSKKVLNELNYYDNIVEVNKGLENSLPEVIIDKEKVIPNLFERIPSLEQQYEAQGLGIYILKQ
ncbi:hypothetical protein [Reichenbachiella versicolor]|uniref:hypothetical protein n=1 Tax=Reichenbachiella versicolor TaxID=1821036 RepID=UPI0013A554A8|nr:hypothetical protein [Reichenbachiella versicolor]